MAAAAFLLNSTGLLPPSLQFKQHVPFACRRPPDHIVSFPKLFNTTPKTLQCSVISSTAFQPKTTKEPIPTSENKVQLAAKDCFFCGLIQILNDAAMAATPMVIALTMMVINMSIGCSVLGGIKPALALSGGCMGGSSSSSWSDSSSSSSDSDSDYDYHRSYNSTSIGSCSSDCSCEKGQETDSRQTDDTALFLASLSIHIAMICYLCSKVMERREVSNRPPRFSVIRLQVGTYNVKTNMQSFLNQVAHSANTSSSEGWSYILQETLRCLCLYWDNCIYGHSEVTEVSSKDRAEEFLKDTSTRERAKFDEETLVNLNGVRRDNSGKYRPPQKGDKCRDCYLVVTILIAAPGDYKLPAIKCREDLKEAVEILQSIPTNKIKALQVLWAPQVENDPLSKQQLRQKYPLLIPLE